MQNHLKRLLPFGLGATLAIVTATGANATIAYNQDLVSPGVFFGSGNGNGGFAVDIGNGIELGLRAKLRQQGPSASNGNGVYGIFPTGTQTLPAPNPNRATWNYEFSINVRADGNMTAALGDYRFELCADLDAGTGVSYECVDPLTNWSDNATVSDGGLDYGAQNSQQLLFADSPGHSAYQINASGLYNFRLTAFDGSSQLAQTEIAARVPEPASLMLVGLGLAGFGVASAHRRRRAHE